ncbi:MAG: FtsX-like permease family protein, partial [Chloroflexota bacterium]|nr:FtsX-like permease family protein [Chloroflexota bacterium]
YVYVANDTDDTVELPVTVSATDGFDRPVPELRETMSVPPGFVRIAIEAESLGVFNRVTISAENAGECVVRIARLPELRMTDSPFGINHAYGWNDYLGLAGLIGITCVRDWSLKWDHVEPEPGTFDFEMTDSQINRPLGLGMNVLCMFPFPSAGWSSTAPPVDEIPEQLSGRARYRIRTAYVKAESRETLDSAIAQITALLADRHDVDPTQPDFNVQTQQDIIATREATTEAFRSLLAWVAGVSLVVGGIGIMNIMLVSVTERTREIGLRQALGARPGDVRMQFLLEAVILSLAGGLVGVIAGVGGSYLFGELGTMRTELVPASVPLAFGAAAAVGIFFGYYPATQAAQLDPIEALRRE